ncbi:MAG TPA: SPOR domain-containing protein [Xanthobacteraceae bacterium]|nr:SPOR domain-containing protein [Xanthobacteraceae bacterium]
MLDLAQGVREQIIKETAPKVTPPKTLTMRALRRLLTWGVCAVGALALAVLTSRSDIGAARIANALYGNQTTTQPQVAAPSFDAQAETKRLADAVRGLAADAQQTKTRIAAVEQNMDDVTGSLSKQIEAAAAAQHNDSGPTVAATASISATMTPLPSPPPNIMASPPMMASPPATMQARLGAGVPLPPEIAYGVDVGSGSTIADLRARWAAIRSAHPQLFVGLEPIVSVKEATHGNRLELRLVVGPLAEAGAAAQLCAALAPFGMFCQPTMFDGQRLAAR